MSNQPWYHQGLRFECTGCGDCCTGDPGYVWVNKAEIEAIAELVGMELAELERQYVRKVGIRKSLRELPGGDCVFFDGLARSCKIYDVRPRQCRTWPFWQSNVRTEADWRYTCKVCPGCGQGQLRTLAQIASQLDVLRV